MKMLRLTGTHGAPILVNPDLVSIISQGVSHGLDGEAPAHSCVLTPNGTSVNVRETVEEIEEKLLELI